MAGTTRLVDESDIVCAVPPTAHRIALASVRKQRSAAFADAMMAAAASAGPINARRVLPLVHRIRIGLAPAALISMRSAGLASTAPTLIPVPVIRAISVRPTPVANQIGRASCRERVCRYVEI